MMQKLALLVLFSMTLMTTSNAQTQYYWSNGGQIMLNPDESSFIVNTTSEGMLSHLSAGSVVEGFNEVKAFDHKKFAIVKPQKLDMKKPEMMAALKLTNEEVTNMTTGYQLSDGFVIYAMPEVVFKPMSPSSLNQITQLLSKYGYNDIQEKFGVYRATMTDARNVFEAANSIYEAGLTQFAHPDFYAPIEHNADPLFGEQFQMHNTGQTIDGVTGVNDMDCNALEAWGVSLGSSSITVAVIDDGMENHEDLNDASGNSRLIGGFTPANGGNGGTTSGSNHGQACSGIIGASHNNIGVQGVAPTVKMISVNIFFGGETSQDIADGITWAKNNGADVMSNSWGYTSCTANFANINNAISDAVTNGRGGLGSVVVFASGNGYKSCVDFPANNSDVIAVGAFTNQGNRSNYSNYGSALDIVAPSNSVSPQPGAGVRTTDRMGSAGYSSGNYTNGFGGTSAACPVVAGVAALVLGYNPTLTDAQIKNILYTTATDMGPSGFDNEFANGRVNAYAALLAAGGGNPATCTDGIQNGQETGVDCGGPDCPACPTGCTDNEISLRITFDNYPEETSWNITNDVGSVVASGGTYPSQPDGSTLIEDLCLPNGCYTFTILDSYGDGICCSYGNGSYTLSDGGTVLASGGSFTTSEATNFCLGGSGPDTTPPTVPTSLTASNTTQTSTNLSWNASSDNIGVEGYNVYVNGTLNGSTASTSYAVTGLTASTTYNMSVSAYDAAGNESASNSVSVTTLDPVGGGPQLVFGHYFESGWDGWADGGSDCFRYSGSRSYEGNYSIRIRDNSGVPSSMTSSTYNLSSFNSVELKFYFYPNSMENGEDFWVRYNDGSGWQTIATYARGTSFENGQFYVATITMDAASYNLSSSASFRFQCDASANADQIYIDEVTLNGFTGGSSFISSSSRNNNTLEALHRGKDLNPDSEDADVLLSPNPVTNNLTVRSEDVMTELEVYSMDGKLLQSKSVDGYQEELNMGGLPAGVYIISITTEEEQIKQRVVKQ